MLKVGEMTSRLQALASAPEDPGLSPSPQLRTIRNSSSKECDSLGMPGNTDIHGGKYSCV